MSRWRKRREPAVQDWLCRVKRIAAIMPSMTQSSLASGKTIEGLLPPSSSETGTMRSEAARMISLPTSVEPVKESFCTVGWWASGAPHSSPRPVSTLSTPGGRNSWHTSARSSTPSGASSAAFRTRVLPAFEFPAQAAEIADDLDGRLCLGARLGAERVPSLERYRARELFHPRLERIRNSREKPSALARDHARPSGKCFSRGVHRTRDVLDAATRNLGDRPAV